MATTFVDYTGDGNATKSFSFPSIKEADIKVEVDNVIKTVSTHYNITSYTTTGGGNVVFTSGNIPASPAAIRILRDTDVDSAKATFTAGSSVKAGDLNNNHTQLLYAAQEEQNQTILTSDIKDAAVTTAKIKADNITSALIADDQINSEHYVDGSIDTAHIADSQITTAKIVDDAVTADKLANSINTEIAANTSKTTNQTHTGDVTGSVALTIASGVVTTAKIADDAVTNAKIADGAIGAAAIADDAVGSAELADNAVATSRIQDNAVSAAKIASNAVTTDKIADSELSTLAGMQSGTASKLADSTALTADIADLNQIDGMAKQTTITDDDTKFPTSGAVVDYVAAQLEPFGGFEAIANEVSFPNTQPVSGVAVSIADATGIVVNGSGVSTTGRTVGGSTVTINGINSQFNSTTIASGVRFIVTSTGSGQVYNYHKATLAESDLVSLSGDINDFAERYRVGSSNPTSSLDNGDLFFNTSTAKLLVYNGTNSAWEEAQSIGNFFISTLSPAFDGTTQDFTLTNAPTNAQQVILSINGVVQKPNAGSSAPSEGFALSGSTVKLSAAPATGSTYHAVVMGSTVNIGTPSNNTVTTAILQNGSVTTAKIVDANVTTAKITDANVTTAKIADANVTTAKIADDAVTDAKLANSINTAISANTAKTSNATHTGEVTGGTALTIADNVVDEANLKVSNSPTNGYLLSAQSGNTGGLTWVVAPSSDLVDDTSPQLGGDLQSNGNDIDFADNDKAIFGTGGDLKIYHNGTDNYIMPSNGNLIINNGSETLAQFISDGAVELYHDNAKKLETTATGIIVKNLDTSDVTKVNIVGPENKDAILNIIADDGDDNADHYRILSSTDGSFYLQNYHSGSWEWNLRATGNGSVDLYYDNSKKFETVSYGVAVTGSIAATNNINNASDSGKFMAGAANDVRMYHDGNDSYFDSVTGNLYYFNHASAKNITFGTEGSSRWQIYNNGHFVPFSNNTFDIGTTSNRVRNIYTNDLHLSNEGHSNEVDGTWGNWTIQEGESDLFLKNNRSGKKYKFNLTEVS